MLNSLLGCPNSACHATFRPRSGNQSPRPLNHFMVQICLHVWDFVMVWSGVAASCCTVGMYVAIDRASGVRNQKRAFALHQMPKTRSSRMRNFPGRLPDHHCTHIPCMHSDSMQFARLRRFVDDIGSSIYPRLLRLNACRFAAVKILYVLK